jgi:membrane protein YqaA with SNARE-associated domain
MFEWLFALVHHWGLLGLFITSFIGATVFVPFTAEVTFPILLKSGIHPLPIMLAAAAGALGGALFNYYLGLKGIQYAHKYVKQEDIDKAQRLMNKYGWVGLFIAMALPVPLPADALTVFVGATEMNVREFSAVIFSAKLVKYALIIGLIDLIL